VSRGSKALQMALWQRRPDVGLAAHSDGAGQYLSLNLGQTAHAAGVNSSIGAPQPPGCGGPIEVWG
jgi:hypothetical protein